MDEVLQLADRVVQVLNDVMVLAGQPVAVRATAGVAIRESAVEDATILVVKVDKSFVRALPATGDRPTVAEALIHLGAALGLTTVAEGIEGPGQQQAVRSSGCSLRQGYLFAKPLSPADAAERLRAEAPRIPDPV